MKTSFEVGTKIPFYLPTLFVHFLNQKKDSNTLLSQLLFAKLNMDQKIYRRISDNIYQTLQEHKEATKELRKIQFRKGKTLFEGMLNNRKDQIPFSRSVVQLICS